ncbi:hypothetical protein GALMADRAFT_145868 [Galerina marginata CBS 339.88]|uniref:Uncharacterized protein n=1 Tax=Galerina marginata (strain CBS 339.88) TaxID=685588 RepID=A0A067SPW7_GALM3|nr:hypothetical protein GALMADRAFT_145868 [Galerina marginata CBS 339.88]
MFMPEMDSGPPPLVDAHTSFIPPPHGASNGGHPGFFDPFPGATGGGGGHQSSSSWIPPHSTPYPSASPTSNRWPTSPAGPPNSAPGWTYGNYPPAGTPVWGPTPPPAVNLYTP